MNRVPTCRDCTCDVVCQTIANQQNLLRLSPQRLFNAPVKLRMWLGITHLRRNETMTAFVQRRQGPTNRRESCIEIRRNPQGEISRRKLFPHFFDIGKERPLLRTGETVPQLFKHVAGALGNIVQDIADDRLPTLTFASLVGRATVLMAYERLSELPLDLFQSQL